MSDSSAAPLRPQSSSDPWNASRVRARIHGRLPDPPAPMRPSRKSAVQALVAGLFVVGIALASSQAARAATPTSSSGGRFKLFSMDCDEGEEGLDTTPQSPPLDVDDPGTPGCNTLEANVIFNGEFARRSKSLEVPLLDLNFGIGDNLQLKYEVPFIWNSEDEEDDEEEGGRVTTRTTGFGNSEIGVKWMFLEDAERSLEAAFYPQVEFESSSHAVEREGLADEGTVLALPLLVSKKLGSTSKGDVMLTANVAYERVFG